MNDKFDRDLNDAFPPTPQRFTIGMEAALRALPGSRRRWKTPGISLAAYALAACAVFTGVFVFAVSPAIAPSTKNSQPPNTSPSPKKLNPAAPAAFPSSEGWQAVAVAGGAQWYYNPRTSEIGRVGTVFDLLGTTSDTSGSFEYMSDGSVGVCATSPDLYNQAIAYNQTSTSKLNIPSGWAVDTYTFLPSNDGRWVAFTLHGPSGDAVWVVTQDGRKMSVPDDVRWIDDSNRPIQADFSNAKLFPMGNSDQYLSDSDLCDDKNNGLLLSATLPNGDIYLLQILLNTDKGNADCLLDDKRGTYYYGYTPPAGQVILDTREFLYQLTRGNDGTYTIRGGNGQYPVDLKSSEISMARFPPRKGLFSSPTKVLIIYAGDTANTLWELNLTTGKESSIATGCVGADWIDENTYWYSVKPDSAAVLTRAAGSGGAAQAQAGAGVDRRMIFSVGASTNDDNGVISASCEASIMATLQNSTAEAVNVPLEVPCALTISVDGKTVWTQNSFKLSDAQHYELMDGDGNDITPPNTPQSADCWVTIPSGGYLEIDLPSISCDFAGTYTLDGTFYNQDPIHIVQTTDCKIQTPQDVRMSGTLSGAGMLTVTMQNGSRETFTPLRSSAQAGTLYVQCRILSGDTVLSVGTLDTTAFLPPSQYDIAPGGSLKIVANSPIPHLSGLPAGKYTLQCCLYDNPDDKAVPWGFVYGYYFEVPFTVPGK